MDDSIVIVSNAGFERWKECIKILANAGWFIAEEDYHRFINGFGEDNFNLTIAIDKNTNKILGCISTGFFKSISNSPALVTLGHYMVLPELQGKGIGTKLFKAALNNPKFKDANFGLNGTAELTAKYAEKFGYNKYPSWQMCKYKIKISDVNVDALKGGSEIDVVDFGDIDYQKLIEYDAKIQGGICRESFLKAFLDSKTNYAKFAIDKTGNILGFGNIRSSSNNQLGLGPLYADSNEIAESLLKCILKAIKDIKSFDYLRTFSPNTNKAVEKILNKLCNGKVDSSWDVPDLCYPQFTKKVIEADVSRIFSITEYDLNMA